ncbi:DUF998 domain-containing protein [Streptomyces sp. ICC1]|uniref:DUF998 domain-containing protein n=1 Tax=Streptomyces sp. ICC1 TaxID=2099583 RepID=UPI000DC77DD8|nr:DUF998 domain-containing protein [Streptomyces sp. ICC1]AWZ15282.1 hypothetical protein DRB96_26885 [Streptomyces sp. ICC1]
MRTSLAGPPRPPDHGPLASGALWVVVSLTQAATRQGYDITRHPLSALSNGSLGWLQIPNFVLAGALAAIGATGLRRALRGPPGRAWAPRLVRLSGLSLIAAGAVVLDPSHGVPVRRDPGPLTLRGGATA